MTATTQATACRRKQRHADKAAALSHIGALARAGSAAWRLIAYRCGACEGWHVAHRPPSRKRARR